MSSDQLLAELYEQLRRMAAVALAREPAGQTLQPTALVHEAFLRLNSPSNPSPWNGRAHFYGAAAEAMRRILVERARAKLAAKRGANPQRESLDVAEFATKYSDHELIDVHDLLEALAAVDAQAAELVRLHVFGGFSVEEAGELLGLSRATAYRDWSFARAWLRDACQTRRTRSDSAT